MLEPSRKQTGEMRAGDPSSFAQSPAMDQERLAQREQRAVLLYQQGRMREAVNEIEQAMLLAPLSDQGWLILAESCSHTGALSLAINAYEHLLTRPKLSAEWYATIYAGLKRAERPGLALAACRTAIEHYPEDDAPYFAMSTQMAALGYPAEYVAAVIAKAVYLAPDKPSYRVSLALQYCRGAMWRQAFHALREVAPSVLQSISCRFSAQMLLKCCLQEGDHRRAAPLWAALARTSSSACQGGQL